MPEGKLHEMMGRTAGHVVKIVTDAALLTSREGLYSGDYLDEWLNPCCMTSSESGLSVTSR